MAIGSAEHKSGYVYIYDERGSQTGMVQMHSNDQLLGYTSSSVSIKKGGYIYVYNEKGSQQSMRQC